MPKHTHEIRDPIHTFIRVDTQERAVIDSRPFQRLRHIHQLALTSFVYPGATHCRFEHSLGVMELATRVFHTVTDLQNVTPQVQELLPELTDEDQKRYWRRVLRLAALCHDIGHLPFSHAAEGLLPEGWDHEQLTMALLKSDELTGLLQHMSPPIRPDDVIKLAVGAKRYPALSFSLWEGILSDIITGDAFGVDRIDYLLRDAYHAGVAYGRFDHNRLIDSLRIVPKPTDDSDPVLGIDAGGLQSAEALLLARYFMYTQVYYHAIRRAYDQHLNDFLRAWLPDGQFSTDLTQHLGQTDNEVLAAISTCAITPDHPAHIHAARIYQRKHFNVLYEWNATEAVGTGAAIYELATEQFGAEVLRHDSYTQRSSTADFPVVQRDGQIASSVKLSRLLCELPLVKVDYVFVDRGLLKDVRSWLGKERPNIQVGVPKED